VLSGRLPLLLLLLLLLLLIAPTLRLSGRGCKAKLHSKPLMPLLWLRCCGCCCGCGGGQRRRLALLIVRCVWSQNELS